MREPLLYPPYATKIRIICDVIEGVINYKNRKILENLLLEVLLVEPKLFLYPALLPALLPALPPAFLQELLPALLPAILLALFPALLSALFQVLLSSLPKSMLLALL